MNGQLLIQRLQECYQNDLSLLLADVQRDREALRGWEEPAHLRAALRRQVRQAQEGDSSDGILQTKTSSLLRAIEPDPGVERESLGVVLETGVDALSKVISDEAADLTSDETVSLTCVFLLYCRPSLLIEDNRLPEASSIWQDVLHEKRQEIERNLRGVGRIELVNHPEYDWAATGFLVSESCLITTRHAAILFAEACKDETWQFRPGVSAWMDFRGHDQGTAACRIVRVIGVHDHYDLALLEVEPNGVRSVLPVADCQPDDLVGRQVYLSGYSIRDSRCHEPDTISRVFREVYHSKRLQPGCLRELIEFNGVTLVSHDCSMLGQSTGSPVIDCETQQVVGLQVSSRFLEPAVAIPLWVFKDDPLFREAGVCFRSPTPNQEIEEAKIQLEQLAQTEAWDEIRSSIEAVHVRVFGDEPNEG
ncbi:MAG: trypsin-like serine peptidase [Gemmataceae bacterium]